MMAFKPLKNLFWIHFIVLDWWSITLNTLTPIRDISSITASYNSSYQHVSLFKESNNKFDRFVNVCWTCFQCKMYYLTINNIICNFTYRCHLSNALVFVRFDYKSLLYIHNNLWIISFKVKFLPILTPLVKNICIGI